MTLTPDTLKAVVDVSHSLTGWAIATWGGSVAVIIGAGYLRPSLLVVRLIYLLFLPGWILLGLSVYSGRILQQNYLAALFVQGDMLRSIGKTMNLHFADQLNYFGYALICFATWLTVYLLWWIFGSFEKTR